MLRRLVSKTAGKYLLRLLDRAQQKAFELHLPRYQGDEHRALLESKADAFHEMRGVLRYYAGETK